MSFAIRKALRSDVPAITDIFQHYVKTSLVSWRLELDRSDVEKSFEARILPWLVLVEQDVDIVRGFAYASPHRNMPGWKQTIENTIYLDERSVPKSKGLGSRLLGELVQVAKESKEGYRQMVALIAVKEGSDLGLASCRLHEKLGFKKCGLMPRCGSKFETMDMDCAIYNLDL